MRIGVLGSGMIAQGLSARLAELGHNVVIGTRNADKLRGWQSSNQRVLIGSFAETAAHGEMVINATNGAGSLNALTLAGEENLADKILVDVSNPLDFSNGFPPSLTVFGRDSLAEQIQRAFSMTRVVKTLNTVTARVMTHPLEVENGDHHVFLSGDDADAKGQVSELLRTFGWIHIFDLGDLTTARGTGRSHHGARHRGVHDVVGEALRGIEHRDDQYKGHAVTNIR
jgi:8-hydroxy-5-deazaflavin:NADPH oxidoreductase